MSHEVYIDGVKYVPAKNIQVANARAIKLALLTNFWGDRSQDSNAELDRKWRYLSVEINESGEGVSIDELLDLITELSDA